MVATEVLYFYELQLIYIVVATDVSFRVVTGSDCSCNLPFKKYIMLPSLGFLDELQSLGIIEN
jgi:hypothetical protein